MLHLVVLLVMSLTMIGSVIDNFSWCHSLDFVVIQLMMFCCYSKSTHFYWDMIKDCQPPGKFRAGTRD